MLHRRVEIDKEEEGVLKIIGLGLSSSGKAGGGLILQSLDFPRSPLNKF